MRKLKTTILLLLITLTLKATPINEGATVTGLGGMGIALIIMPANPPLAFVVGITTMAVGIIMDQKGVGDVKKKRNNK